MHAPYSEFIIKTNISDLGTQLSRTHLYTSGMLQHAVLFKMQKSQRSKYVNVFLFFLLVNIFV